MSNHQISITPQVVEDIGVAKSRNLWALACGLKRLSELGLDSQFSMQLYHDQADEGFAYLPPPCGSMRCAVGWAPALGIGGREAVNLWEMKTRRWIRAHTYYDEFSSMFLVDFYAVANAWSWMFSSDWSEVDNTLMGAADRIAFALCQVNSLVWETNDLTFACQEKRRKAQYLPGSEFTEWRKQFSWDVVPDIPGAVEAAASAVKEAENIARRHNE